MLSETIPAKTIPAAIPAARTDHRATWAAPGVIPRPARQRAAAREDAWTRVLAHWALIPLAGAGVAVATSLTGAGALGFPVDDGWIHQDFARTLATTGQFAFQPGGGAAGATSPLWVLLLTPPYLVAGGHAPLWMVVGWSALLATLALGGLGMLAGLAAAEVAHRHGATERVARIVAVLAGLAVVAEWQLVWAAVSGMETDVFACLALLLVVAANRRTHPLWLGLLAGATIAARPEGAIVAVLVAAGAAWSAVRSGAPPRARAARRTAHLGVWVVRWGLPYAAGTLVWLIPYVALNLTASGHVLPSTFYAKRVGIGGASGTMERLISYATQMGAVLVAANPVLLAVAALAAAYWLSRLLHARRGAGTTWPAAPALDRTPAADFPLTTLLWLWPVALAAALATTMPGAWQYGRYLMPALAPLLALGAASLAPLFRDERPRVAPLVGVVMGLAVALSLVGARVTYASDVRSVDDYHVAVALWLRTHTAPGDVIATHDIGAIGYFSDRRVIDFAGLATPQMIPLLANQAAIEAYLWRHHVAYVVMRPDWFPAPALMAHDLASQAVYRACGLGECFTVYQTGW
jgi:hypothetical protein